MQFGSAGWGTAPDFATNTAPAPYANDYRTPDVLDFSAGGAISGDEPYYEAETSAGLQFDGSNDYVDISTVADNFNSNTGTAEAWVYRTFQDTTTAYPTPISIGRISNSNITEVWFNTDSDVFNFHYIDGSGVEDFVNVPSAQIPQNQWVHIAWTWDTTTDEFKVYINGSQAGTTQALTGTWSLAPTVAYISASTDVTGPSNYWQGLIDEVRIWNTARTQSQIQDNMYKELVGNESGLVGYWKLNEGTGTSANDSTANANNGTLTGGPSWATGYQGDGYNEAEGAYTITAGGTYTTGTPQAVFDLDGSTYTRYNPVFKLRHFTSFTDPTYYIEGGAAKTNGTDFNADLVPFTDAYFMNDTAGAPTMTDLAQAGDTADASEKLSSTSQDQTLTLDEAAATPNNNTPDGDAIYFGSHNKFFGLNIDLDTLGAGGAGEWQYWDGDSWNDITVSETATNASKFFADGAIYWQDTNVLGWQKTAAPLGDETNAVAYYDFNEGTGTTINDRSGTGNTGTLTIGATGSQTTTTQAWTNGASGRSSGAMSFDGTDDYVTCGTGSSLNLTSSGTIEVWFKITGTLPTYAGLVSKSSSGNTDGIAYVLGKGSGGNAFRINLSNGTTDQSVYTTTSSWATGQWYHIVATWDGTTVKMYVNGQQEANPGQTVNAQTLGTTPLEIGRAYAGYQSYWPGLIDEVRIFNTSRTAAQIKADYERGRQYYYTRFVATTAYTTNPVENQIKTDLMVVQDLTNTFDSAAGDTVGINVSSIQADVVEANGKTTNTWYQGDGTAFTFSSANLNSGAITYYKYVWDTSSSTDPSSGATWSSGNLNVPTGTYTKTNSKNLYLHVLAYKDGIPVAEGAKHYGPYYHVQTSRLLKHGKFFDDDGVLQNTN
jgi:hypothetical protein